MPELNETRIAPVAYRDAGFEVVPEGEHDFFSTTVYQDTKNYGSGWFPLYDFESGVTSDAFGYMYRSKDRAARAVAQYKEKHQ